MIVVDASVLLRACLKSSATSAALSTVSRSDAIAPDIVLAEVANGLWRYVRAGQMQASEAEEVLEAAALIVARLPVTPERLAAALRIACEVRHPVYDCIYLALAIEQRAALATSDVRLAEKARQKRIEVVLLP
jgi:predicted nucleic acid-binding protein